MEEGDQPVSRRKCATGKTVKEKHIDDIWCLVCSIKNSRHIDRVLLKNGKRSKKELEKARKLAMVAVDQNLSGLNSSPQACAYNPPPTTRSDLSAVSLPSTNTPSNLSAPLPSTAPSFATPSELPSTAPLSLPHQNRPPFNQTYLITQQPNLLARLHQPHMTVYCLISQPTHPLLANAPSPHLRVWLPCPYRSPWMKDSSDQLWLVKSRQLNRISPQLNLTYELLREVLIPFPMLQSSHLKRTPPVSLPCM